MKKKTIFLHRYNIQCQNCEEHVLPKEIYFTSAGDVYAVGMCKCGKQVEHASDIAEILQICAEFERIIEGGNGKSGKTN